MFCDNCGKELTKTSGFCPQCGNAIKQEKSKKQRNNKINIKIIMIVLVVLCVCVVAAFGIKSAYTAYSNKPENKFKKTAKEFVESIDSGNYESAQKLLISNDNITGNFKDFAKENLKGAKLEKSADGYTLVTSNDSYQLTSNKSGEKITSDDFFMEYQVKCSSYLTRKPFSGSSSEVLDDGMTLYTVKAYKTHNLSFSCEVGLGDESVIPATVKVTTDKKYVVDEITSAYKNGNEDESYNGAYIEDDGTIVFDLYYISESYAEKVARIASGAATDMMNAALSGESFDDFYSRYNNYIFKTDSLKEDYEKALSGRNTYTRYIDYMDYTAERWEYPLEFRYSNGEYVVYETIKCTSYKNNKEQGTASDSMYALFKPGKNAFKLFATANEKSELYRVSDISDTSDASDTSDVSESDTDNLEEWKQAYIEYFANVDFKPIATILVDVNNDNIPEVFCSWDQGAITYSAYYIDKSGDVRAVFDNWSHISISYGENYIRYEGAHSGEYFDTVFKYNNETGEFETEFDGIYYDYDENFEPYLDEDGNVVMRYMLDDTSCTEDEYYDTLNEICGNVDFLELDFDSDMDDVAPSDAIKNY